MTPTNESSSYKQQQVDSSLTEPEDNTDDAKSQDSSNKSIDITTEEGKQNVTAGSSALSKYLQHMGDIQQEAMDKLFSATVDGPCSASTCEGDVFGERMDNLTMVSEAITIFYCFGKNKALKCHMLVQEYAYLFVLSFLPKDM